MSFEEKYPGYDEKLNKIAREWTPKSNDDNFVQIVFLGQIFYALRCPCCDGNPTIVRGAAIYENGVKIKCCKCGLQTEYIGMGLNYSATAKSLDILNRRVVNE